MGTPELQMISPVPRSALVGKFRLAYSVVDSYQTNRRSLLEAVDFFKSMPVENELDIQRGPALDSSGDEVENEPMIVGTRDDEDDCDELTLQDQEEELLTTRHEDYRHARRSLMRHELSKKLKHKDGLKSSTLSLNPTAVHSPSQGLEQELSCLREEFHRRELRLLELLGSQVNQTEDLEIRINNLTKMFEESVVWQERKTIMQEETVSVILETI